VFSRFAGFRTASAHLPTRFGKVLLDFDIVVLNLSKKANFGAVKICLLPALLQALYPRGAASRLKAVF